MRKNEPQLCPMTTLGSRFAYSAHSVFLKQSCPFPAMLLSLSSWHRSFGPRPLPFIHFKKSKFVIFVFFIWRQPPTSSMIIPRVALSISWIRISPTMYRQCRISFQLLTGRCIPVESVGCQPPGRTSSSRLRRYRVRGWSRSPRRRW